MFRRSAPPEAVSRHRRARPSVRQWLTAPARRAAVLGVSGALALAGVVVAVATVGTPAQDTASRQADGGSTGVTDTSSEVSRSLTSRSPSWSLSSVTGSATSTGESATASSPTSAGATEPLTLSGVLGLSGSPARGLTASSTRPPSTSTPTSTSTSTSPEPTSPTTSPAPQSPVPTSVLPTPVPTPTSPLPTNPGKPPGSSLHPSPGHGATHNH